MLQRTFSWSWLSRSSEHVERPRRRHVGVAHDGFDRRWVELPAQALDAGVAEAVEGERRLVRLDAIAGEHERVGGGRRAQQPGRQLALVEDLGVLQGDRVAGFAAHADADPPGDVLSEVDDGDVGRRLLDGDRPQRLDAAHRRAGRRHQPIGHRRQLGDGDPVGVVEVGCRPRRFGQPGVVRLAVVEAGRDALVEGGPPVAIGDHGVDAAVVVVQFELGDRSDVGAVGVAPSTAEAEPAAVPAFGDGHPEDVVADLQRLGDVERLVAEPMAVRRPAGGEDVVAERRAVAGDGVDAQRRGVQPGPRQAGADGEAAPEPDRPLGGGAREGGGDRHG